MDTTTIVSRLRAAGNDDLADEVEAGPDYAQMHYAKLEALAEATGQSFSTFLGGEFERLKAETAGQVAAAEEAAKVEADPHRRKLVDGLGELVGERDRNRRDYLTLAELRTLNTDQLEELQTKQPERYEKSIRMVGETAQYEDRYRGNSNRDHSNGQWEKRFKDERQA
jgi:hypothetical protein